MDEMWFVNPKGKTVETFEVQDKFISAIDRFNMLSGLEDYGDDHYGRVVVNGELQPEYWVRKPVGNLLQFGQDVEHEVVIAARSEEEWANHLKK